MSQLRRLSHKRSRLFLLVCTNVSQWFWAKWCPLMTHVEQRVLFMFHGRKKSPFQQNHLCYRRCFSCIYKITILRKKRYAPFFVYDSISSTLKCQQLEPNSYSIFTAFTDTGEKNFQYTNFFVQRSFKCGHQTLRDMTRRQEVLQLYYMHNIFIFNPS